MPCPYEFVGIHYCAAIVIPGRNGAQGKKQGAENSANASLLDSAPSDSSDDSGPVLTMPPSRLGGTAVGDFGGNYCCTFRSGLRRSSEHLPGYCLLPHLYEDNLKIASGGLRVKFRTKLGRRPTWA